MSCQPESRRVAEGVNYPRASGCRVVLVIVGRDVNGKGLLGQHNVVVNQTNVKELRYPSGVVVLRLLLRHRLGLS